jgi:hypothetical protein
MTGGRFLMAQTKIKERTQIKTDRKGKQREEEVERNIRELVEGAERENRGEESHLVEHYLIHCEKY